MAKKKEVEQQIAQTDQQFENVEIHLNRFEQFFEEHSKTMLIAAASILAIVAIIFLVKTQYYNPLKAEAQKEIFNAQYAFEADSFKLALNGDGVNPGFLGIIDDYGSTPAGNLAHYYAGVCYMHLGEWDNAKKHLSDFDTDDEILGSMATGLQGDCEAQLGNADGAVKWYRKAADAGCKLTAPMFLQKLGNTLETMGRNPEALEAYKAIKDNYPQSSFASQVDKYIAAIKE